MNRLTPRQHECGHERVYPTKGGFRCVECQRHFYTEASTEEGAALRRSVVDLTAMLNPALEELYRLERHIEQMDLVLMRLGWSLCSHPDCLTYFGQSETNEVDGLPYCEEHYDAAWARFHVGADDDPRKRLEALAKEGKITLTEVKAVPQDYDDEEVTRCAPRWAWEVIDETLRIDSQSSACTTELREAIGKAYLAMCDCCERAED